MRAVSVDSDAALIDGDQRKPYDQLTLLWISLWQVLVVFDVSYYNSIEPLMGMTPGIKALVAAVLEESESFQELLLVICASVY